MVVFKCWEKHRLERGIGDQWREKPYGVEKKSMRDQFSGLSEVDSFCEVCVLVLCP